MWDSVESLLQVEEGSMDGLVLFAVLLQEESRRVDRVRCAEAFDESALVFTDVHDLSQSLIDDSFQDLEGVTHQANWAVGRAVCDVSFAFPDGNCGTSRP